MSKRRNIQRIKKRKYKFRVIKTNNLIKKMAGKSLQITNYPTQSGCLSILRFLNEVQEDFKAILRSIERW